MAFDYLAIKTNQKIGKIDIFSTLGIKVLETGWKERINVRVGVMCVFCESRRWNAEVCEDVK